MATLSADVINHELSKLKAMSIELEETATEIKLRKNDLLGKPISDKRRAEKLAAITQGMPKYLRAVAACSRELPVPKFLPETITSPGRASWWKRGS